MQRTIYCELDNPVIRKCRANEVIRDKSIAGMAYISLHRRGEGYVDAPLEEGFYNGRMRNPKHLQDLAEATRTVGINNDCLENAVHIEIKREQVSRKSLVPLTHDPTVDGEIPFVRFKHSLLLAHIIWYLLNGAHRLWLARHVLQVDLVRKMDAMIDAARVIKANPEATAEDRGHLQWFVEELERLEPQFEKVTRWLAVFHYSGEFLSCTWVLPYPFDITLPDVFEEADAIFDADDGADPSLGSGREARFLITSNPSIVNRPDGTKEILGVAFRLLGSASERMRKHTLDHLITTYGAGNSRCINIFRCRPLSRFLCRLFVYRAFEQKEFTTVVKLNNLINVNALVSLILVPFPSRADTPLQFIQMLGIDGLNILDILSKDMPNLPEFKDAPSAADIRRVLDIFRTADVATDDVLGATFIDIFEDAFCTHFVKTGIFAHFGAPVGSTAYNDYMAAFKPYIINIETNLDAIFTTRCLESVDELTRNLVRQLSHKLRFIFGGAQLPNRVPTTTPMPILCPALLAEIHAILERNEQALLIVSPFCLGQIHLSTCVPLQEALTFEPLATAALHDTYPRKQFYCVWEGVAKFLTERMGMAPSASRGLIRKVRLVHSRHSRVTHLFPHSSWPYTSLRLKPDSPPSSSTTSVSNTAGLRGMTRWPPTPILQRVAKK